MEKDGGQLISPLDQYNEQLLRNVHPPGWKNPMPAPRYNLVVLGAGTAGLVTAIGAAGLGARVALVEKNLMGGDCLNVGCVPSKGLIRAARAAAAVREAASFGVRVPTGTQVDFPQVMERMRRLRAQISPNDSAERCRQLGVDVFLGTGSFTGEDSVEVAGQTLRFAKAVIATGARAAVPPVPGLADVPYLTNETVFSLTELPRRLGVIGAGPIGCELAQAFARFGSETHLFASERGILPREEREAAKILEQALVLDGVKLLHCARSLVISKSAGGIRMHASASGPACDIEVDSVLVAAGRAPNVEGMGLEKVGVQFDGKGVKVNDHLQTTNPRIYAAGDICSPYQFTHSADFLARIVIRNALFRGRSRVSALVIPWCTYTSPEIAHVGLWDGSGMAIDSYSLPLTEVDRAVLDGETEGFVRVHVCKGTDKIVGATIVAAHAGEMISEIAVAMVGKLGLKTVAATMHPYPTQAEALRKVGDAYNRTRLTPIVKKIMGRWLSWQRS